MSIQPAPELHIPGMTIDRMRCLLAMRGLEKNTLPPKVVRELDWLRDNGFIHPGEYNGFHSLLTPRGETFARDLEAFCRNYRWLGVAV